MTQDILDLSDEILDGKSNLPMTGLILNRPHELHEIGEGLAVVLAFGNVMPVRTGNTLTLVDTGNIFQAPANHDLVKNWSDAPLEVAVFTHGHVDHAMGMGPWDAEADAAGRPRARVVAHEAILARFERYALTAGWNGIINQRQFSIPGLTWPTEYRSPDETYRSDLVVEAGDSLMELHHARGETDDHTWVFLPEQKVLYPGDLFIWCVPNAGNPQKVQRYAKDWAVALRDMAAKDAELFVPSHGLPIRGADRIRTALVDTAALLESLHDQTVALMNQGCSLNDVIHMVEIPSGLLDKPYLTPIYDEPEFIVRNVWRFYGGWHDGNPAHLKPARDPDLAREIASLAGGPQALAERAAALLPAGDRRIAAHLAEFAFRAAPDDREVNRIRAEVFTACQEDATSLMAKGIYGAAVRESREAEVSGR